MASFAPWGSRGTLFLGLVIAAGCAPEQPHYGPPQDADTSTLPSGGGGGGSGGGAGGENACECAYEAALGKPDCADCINALGPNGKCPNEIFTCENEPDCLGILHCPVKCYGKTGADLTACVDACFASPANQQAYQQFQDLMACVCPICASECTTSQSVTCP